MRELHRQVTRLRQARIPHGRDKQKKSACADEKLRDESVQVYHTCHQCERSRNSQREGHRRSMNSPTPPEAPQGNDKCDCDDRKQYRVASEEAQAGRGKDADDDRRSGATERSTCRGNDTSSTRQASYIAFDRRHERGGSGVDGDEGKQHESALCIDGHGTLA
jgi:hypothetical protein